MTESSPLAVLIKMKNRRLILSAIAMVIGGIWIGLGVPNVESRFLLILWGMWVGICIVGMAFYVVNLPASFMQAVRENGFGGAVKAHAICIFLLLTCGWVFFGGIVVFKQILDINKQIKEFQSL